MRMTNLMQVPKSYKAPVFLEQLVAGLSDQGTVSLECKVLTFSSTFTFCALGSVPFLSVCNWATFQVVGIPSPALRWFRDGEEIRSSIKIISIIITTIIIINTDINIMIIVINTIIRIITIE